MIRMNWDEIKWKLKAPKSWVKNPLVFHLDEKGFVDKSTVAYGAYRKGSQLLVGPCCWAGAAFDNVAFNLSEVSIFQTNGGELFEEDLKRLIYYIEEFISEHTTNSLDETELLKYGLWVEDGWE